MTLGQLYQQALMHLGEGAVDRYSILTLMQHHENIASKDTLLTHLDWPAKHVESFLLNFQRLKQGEPVAYIIGHTTFLDIKLKVNANVLIPRQETEELVMWILNNFSNDQKLNVIDVGTGSGAIALALKHQRPNWKMIATDISSFALGVAKDNAKTLNLDIEFVFSDGFQHVTENCRQALNLVVSNPPYVKTMEELDPNVVAHEPELALLANPVTKFYEQYLTEAMPFLASNAVFAFEISPDVSKSLHLIVQKIYPHARLRIIKDINLKDRVAIIYT